MPETIALTTTIALRDGREAIIRPVTRADAMGILEMDRCLHRVGLGTMRLLGELPADEAQMIDRLSRWIGVDEERRSARGHMVVAVVDGRIVGQASLKRHRLMRLRHNAVLALGVDPPHQGVGVGRAMILSLIEWCRWTQRVEDVGVRRLELSVISDNARAIGLYLSLGFSEQGRMRDKVRDADGSLRDDIVMALDITEA